MAETTMGIKLDPQTRERLKELGQRKDRSPHWIMKAAILEYLSREERYEREKEEDRARWETYQRTGAHISNDAMNAWLDRWGTDDEKACPAPSA
jgi:predicted transcriptional regulator